MITMTRYLTGRENNENKYTQHEITRKMFENNKDFYDDVVRKNFDIRLFEKSFRKSDWRPSRVVAFLAFCNAGEEEDFVMSLLEKWHPNWRSQFWWFVFLNKILHDVWL